METAAPWFLRLCGKYGFENEADALAALLRPSIALVRTDADTLVLGSSRIGGGPDAPLDFVWPESGGRSLDFVLQLNLADVPDGAGLGLPRTGVLSFFYDFETQPSGNSAEERDGHRVYLSQNADLVARHPPSDSELALGPAALTLARGLRLPHPFSADGEQAIRQLRAQGIAWDEKRDFQYFDLVAAAAEHHAGVGKPLHALGGYAHNVQGDMQLKAELLTRAFATQPKDRSVPSEHSDQAPANLRWKLLLQLDSDDMDEMWGDSGMLYYWVRSDHLLAEDFSSTWMIQQSC